MLTPLTGLASWFLGKRAHFILLAFCSILLPLLSSAQLSSRNNVAVTGTSSSSAPLAQDRRTHHRRVPPMPQVPSFETSELPQLDFDLQVSAAPAPPPDDRAASLGRVIAAPRPATRIDVIRVVIGFLVLMTLAYAGAHPAVQRLERRFRISQLTTTGLPFVLLGIIASNRTVGVLTPEVLTQIRPALTFGLGWIGFAVGFRFSILSLIRMPKGTSSIAVGLTFPPAVAIAGFAALVLSHSHRSPLFFRDALVIGFAGAMAATSAPLFLETTGASKSAVDRVAAIVELEQLAGVFGLMLLAAYFRPHATSITWQLPGTAWIFVTVGMAAVMAAIAYILFSKAESINAFTVLLLGSVLFTAGTATVLQLSAVVVCFITGATLVNLPSPWREQVQATLSRFERPVYFLFLTIAGALWRGVGWHAWLLMLVFVVTRLGGKWLGMAISQYRRPTLTVAERRSLIVAPMGALSLAIVVSAQTLYAEASMPAIVTAVIGGSILTELIIQWAARAGYLSATEDEWKVRY